MSVTSRLDRANDPIRIFMRERFPNTGTTFKQIRAAIDGAETLRPSGPVP